MLFYVLRVRLKEAAYAVYKYALRPYKRGIRDVLTPAICLLNYSVRDDARRS